MLTPDDLGGALSFPDEGASVWSWDVPSGAVTWSSEIDALFGLPPGGFGGTYEAYIALVHPEDRAQFQALIARTLEGEDDYVMSHRVLWPDGSVHWVDGRGRLTRSADGRPLRLDGVAWDAGVCRRAASSVLHLRRVQAVAGAVSKELLRVQSEREAFELACRIAVEHGHFRFAWIGLADASTRAVAPVARAGFEGGYLDEIAVTADLSARGRGPAGRSIREGVTVVVNDIATDPGFAPWREAALARGYRGCATFPLRRGGESIGAFAIYAGDGNHFDRQQLDLLQSLADDMGFALDALGEAARRRAAEAAMGRSEERFRALFEQASDAIFLADAGDQIVDVNPAACELGGAPRGALCEKSLGVLFEPVLARSDLAHGEIAERRLTRKDGTSLEVEISATVLADGGLQAHVRDVTTRKRMQQRLLLADRLASLGRLAAGVAHEVNNPLACVMLNLERIQRATVEDVLGSARIEEIRAANGEARAGAERVRAVVRALGALGRDDAQVVGGVDVHGVLEGAIRLAENRARRRGRIVTELAATRGVRGNELRLGQVFVNLLLNAVDALRERAASENEIRVRTFDEGVHVVVEVRDNGVGIAPELRGKIFDPFFTTKGVGEGTGLGLAIADAIVRSFGGEIGVESTPGLGTTFRVALLAEESELAPAPPSSGTPTPARARILIVDDEPGLARALALTLETHDVVVATSGAEAVRLCGEHDFDCILCDLMMPEMSGIDVHGALARARPGLERRMVFMTGGAFTARGREFFARAENPVLEKPFAPSLLARTLAHVIATASPLTPQNAR